MALAAVVSAAACAAAWRTVPWQGRQAALIMTAAMLVIAATHGDVVVGLTLGVVLLVSAMLGTVGVRGTRAAATCCHRALVSLVMAMCSFDSVATGSTPAAGHGGHSLSGVLSALVIVGTVVVVGWTLTAEWSRRPTPRISAVTALRVESQAMAAGVAIMCVGF